MKYELELEWGNNEFIRNLPPNRSNFHIHIPNYGLFVMSSLFSLHISEQVSRNCVPWCTVQRVRPRRFTLYAAGDCTLTDSVTGKGNFPLPVCCVPRLLWLPALKLSVQRTVESSGILGQGCPLLGARTTTRSILWIVFLVSFSRHSVSLYSDQMIIAYRHICSDLFIRTYQNCLRMIFPPFISHTFYIQIEISSRLCKIVDNTCTAFRANLVRQVKSAF